MGRVLRKVGKLLRSPAGSVLALGPLSFLEGLSLFIVLPMLLVGMVVVSVIVWSLIPFAVAAIVMLTTYAILSYFGMRDPWRHILPVLFGLIALTPTFVNWVQQATVSSVAVSAATQAQAVQAQGFLEKILEMISQGPLFIAAFMILVFIAIGLASIARLGSAASFVAGFLAIALGVGLALNVTGLSAPYALALPGTEGDMDIKKVTTPSGEIKGWGAKRWTWHKHSWAPVPCADSEYEGHLGTLTDETWREKEPADGGTYVWDYIKYTTSYDVKQTVAEWGSDSLSSVRAKFDVDPPAGFTDYLLVNAKKTGGDLNFSPTDGISRGEKFFLTVSGPGEKGKLKFAVTVGRKTYVPPGGEMPKKPRFPKKPLGIPPYLWILAIGGVAVPSFVYIGEKEGWW